MKFNPIVPERCSWIVPPNAPPILFGSADPHILPATWRGEDGKPYCVIHKQALESLELNRSTVEAEINALPNPIP